MVMTKQQSDALEYIDEAKKRWEDDVKRLGLDAARREYKKLVDHANQFGLGTSLAREFPDGVKFSAVKHNTNEASTVKPISDRDAVKPPTPLGILPASAEADNLVKNSPEAQKIQAEADKKMADLEAQKRQEQIEADEKLRKQQEADAKKNQK